MKIAALFLVAAAAISQAAWTQKYRDGPTFCDKSRKGWSFDGTKPKPIYQIAEEFCNENHGKPAFDRHFKVVAVQTAEGESNEIDLLLFKVAGQIPAPPEKVDRDMCFYQFKRVIRQCVEEVSEGDLTHFVGGASWLDNGPWAPGDQLRAETWSGSIHAGNLTYF